MTHSGFRNYAAAGDVVLRKLTLVYAENGRGKTTLCAILRSLQSGQSEFIAERKTLATADPASVHIRLSGTNMQFANNAWTVSHPDIAIFDPVFVNENVYSGDYVEHEHKKNLYRVIVGAQGVTLARQVDDLDARIREANSDIRDKSGALTRYVPSGTSLEQFLSITQVENVDEKIQQKSDEITARQKSIEKASEIRSRALMSRVQVPSLPEDFTATLARSVANIYSDAESRVREHVAHFMDRRGESWLTQGLGYVKNEQCPFCSQDIKGSGLIAAYRSYFNTEYKNLKEEVAGLEQRVNIAIGESSLNRLLQSVSTNQTLAEFWRQFFEINIPEFPLEAVKNAFERLHSECATLIQGKQSNPLEPVTPGGGFTEATAAIQQHQHSVDVYNAAVDACNARINEQKTAASQGTDVSILCDELADLKVAKHRFEQDVVHACEEYQNAQEAKKQLEEQKRTAKERLDQYCTSILQSFEQSINEYLDQFNTGFRIVNSRHQYTGGSPSCYYQIAINNIPVDLGDSRTPTGTSSFKTTLSSGDRSALALAFFLAVLKQDQQISQKIIVLDDPFTSLDRFRRICTQQLIQRLSDSAQQVLVLSHDPFFLKLLSDECPSPNTNVKTLQMSKSGDTTVIGEWNMEAEVQSAYMKDFSTLLGFYRERKSEPREVARAIRPFLEGLLRSHFPGHFPQNEWLGDFLEKIRDAQPSSGLQHAKADINELNAINGYSKKYHHEQNANFDREPINEDELHGYVKRTLRLVGGI